MAKTIRRKHSTKIPKKTKRIALTTSKNSNKVQSRKEDKFSNPKYDNDNDGPPKYRPPQDYHASLACQAADSNFYHKRWIIDELRVEFLKIPTMHYTDKYYPQAKPKPLYVDEPITSLECARSLEKSKIMESLGLRFIIVKKDSTWEEIAEQLGELDGRLDNIEKRTA